ncbi:MAG: DUF4157 domain-containing protein [Cyclobacteriaceae bacterium]
MGCIHHCRQFRRPNSPYGSRGLFFQPKLAFNQPNDHDSFRDELEANTAADKVMRITDTKNISQSFFKPVSNQILLKCACSEVEEKTHRNKGVNTDVASSLATKDYLNSLSGGCALTESERNFFEPTFGFDFSKVKLHSDNAANESAKELNALAFTTGNHIVFRSGQYQPATEAGKKLLAHELTHVVQQSGNVSHKIQRQPEKDKEEPKSDIAKAFQKNSLFRKLPDFAQEKILKEIDNAPETITKAVLDKIIDLAPIDAKYKEGLKKVGEAIIKTVTGKKSPSTSICDAIPGYHEGGSSTFKGQCCAGTVESAQSCCPKDRFAPNESFGNCCKPGEVVDSLGKCMKPGPVDLSTICIPPGKKDSLGKCCMPPLEVMNGICLNPPGPTPKPLPLSLKFRIGVIDGYKIDESVINSRQKPTFEAVKNQIHGFMEACPASIIYVTGFADKPGSEEHNQDLGQRRADHVKFLLQLDLMKINFGGFGPLIFTRSEGENLPADTEAGENFSARNRRVEIEFHSMCPALSLSSGKSLFPE